MSAIPVSDHCDELNSSDEKTSEESIHDGNPRNEGGIHSDRHKRRSRESRLEASLSKGSRTILNKYEIGTTLGFGSYARVLFGRNLYTQRRVALKILDQNPLNELQIQNEIKLLSTVKNKNVLKLLDYEMDIDFPEKDGKKTKSLMVVLEYAANGDLFDQVIYCHHLGETVCRSFFMQLINGLSAIHEAGFIHRDLKPSNLLLDKHYNLKIADYGFSAKGKEFRSRCGTRGYFAPELVDDPTRYSIKSDIFAAGVILFIMYAGFPPFNDANTRKDWWYNRISNGWKEREAGNMLDRHGEWSRHGLVWKSYARKRKFPGSLKELLLKIWHHDPALRPSCDDFRRQPNFFWQMPAKLYGSARDEKKSLESNVQRAVKADLPWCQKRIYNSAQIQVLIEDRRRRAQRDKMAYIRDKQERYARRARLAGNGGRKSQEWAVRGGGNGGCKINSKYDHVIDKMVRRQNIDYNRAKLTKNEMICPLPSPFGFLTSFPPNVVVAAFVMICENMNERTTYQHFPHEGRLLINGYKEVPIAGSRSKEDVILLECQFDVVIFRVSTHEDDSDREEKDVWHRVWIKRVGGDTMGFQQILADFMKKREIIEIIDADSDF